MKKQDGEKHDKLLSALRREWHKEPSEAHQADVSASVIRTIRTQRVKQEDGSQDAGTVWLAASAAAAAAAFCCVIVFQQKTVLFDLGLTMMVGEGGFLPGIL